MGSPSYRRSRTSLSCEEVSRLVRMREDGATWKDIGRAFKKQDGACKSIFDKARAAQTADARA